jgi:type IV secretory pathway VirD2 relaxase
MTAMRDDDFEPKPGKIGNRQSKRGRSYLQRIVHASVLAGARGAARTFTGSRIGRGSGIGRVLSTRDRYAALRTRRVIIKSRIVKLAGKGLAAAKAHLRYIQRDGVTRDGQPGQLYDAEREGTDGKAFLERGVEDRHQFRFIVSAEDGSEYEDLKPFVRRLMAQTEADLGTKLDWVAVDHFNTGHPHTHVMLRGKDDKGQDLIIARDYISQGMRERAAEIVAFDFGPRADHDIEARLRSEVEQDRFTGLDRNLLRLADRERMVAPSHGQGSPFERTLHAARLQKLARLELADEIGPGRWQLAPDMEDVLRRMGERGDIIKTLHHALHAHGAALDPTQLSVHESGVAQTLVGEVVARGLSDEINDGSYLVLNGADGRAHYVDIGRADETAEVRRGTIVALEPSRGGIREADLTVAEIAAGNAGRYSVDLHLRTDPSASVEFAQAHVRRLEAMRRAGGFATRERDGSWQIGPDHLAKVEAFEQSRARLTPVGIEILSRVPLAQQVGADGATWLDKQIATREPEAVTTVGFGREVRDALQRRRQWLLAEGLAREENGAFVVRANLLATLQRRELIRVAGQLSTELGLPYTETKPGDRIVGIYRRPVELASGRFALIEKARDFTLAPWRLVLERTPGRPVSGIARADGVSWSLRRDRGLDIG